MSDNLDPNSSDNAGDGQGEPETHGLSQRLDSLAGENKDLKSQVVRLAAVQAGADPSNPAHAFMLEKYDGPATAEGVTEFLSRMGVTPQQAQPEQETQATQPSPETAGMEANLSELAAGLNAMAGSGQAGGSQPSQADQIRQLATQGASQAEILAAIPSEFLAVNQ
jgi:hypothetical protein